MKNYPKKIGPYQLIREVGAGGLGRVFKAIDERSGRSVAVKFLHTKYSTNRRFLGIFHRELLIVSRLKHKHIVNYLDSHFDPPLCFIVTEFVDGWSGYQLLKLTGKLPPLVALSIAMDMLQGIDYLNLHDVVHSDLSAANYLINKEGKVMVTDFGLACEQNIENYKNFVIGTPGYYSPEHLKNTGIVPASDIYAVGLNIYELLTGEKAVKPSTDRRKILASMREIDFSKIICTDRKLEKKLRRFVKRSLQVSTWWRTPSAEAMVIGVYKILKEYGIRYSRHAIKQFLVDKRLSSQSDKLKDQDIYQGAA